jgi:hypothetical protein
MTENEARAGSRDEQERADRSVRHLFGLRVGIYCAAPRCLSLRS